jgi:hypothetical protein
VPFLDRLGVALGSPLDGQLHAPARRLQQAPNVLGAVADTKRPLDDLRDPATGPDVAAIPPRFRPTGEQVGHLGPLVGRQAWRGAWAGPGLQRLRSALPAALDPAADRPFAHAERARNVFVPPTLLREDTSALSVPLTLLVGDVLRHLSMGSCFTLLSGDQ